MSASLPPNIERAWKDRQRAKSADSPLPVNVAQYIEWASKDRQRAKSADSPLPDNIKKAWGERRASREALQEPEFNPVDVVQSALFPEGKLASLLVKSVAPRLSSALSTASMEALLSWLNRHNPNHPWWNTIAGIVMGVLAGKGTGRLLAPGVPKVTLLPEGGLNVEEKSLLAPPPAPDKAIPLPDTKTIPDMRRELQEGDHLTIGKVEYRVRKSTPDQTVLVSRTGAEIVYPGNTVPSRVPIRKARASQTPEAAPSSRTLFTAPKGTFEAREINRAKIFRDPSGKIGVMTRELSRPEYERLKESGWTDLHGALVKKDTPETETELANFLDTKDPFSGTDLEADAPYAGPDMGPKYSPPPESATFESTLIPGARQFFEQDVGPAFDHFRNSWDHLKRMFSPSSRGPMAERTARLIRAHMGQAALSAERAYAPVEKLRTFFSRQPVEDSLAFLHAVETGRKITDPRLSVAAASMRSTFDALWAKMNDMGLLNSYVENYFPHLWKDERYANETLSRYVGKRPWEGTRSFTKERFYGTIAEGMQAGKELVSSNPVDLFTASVADMNRLIHAREAWNQLKEEGLARFVRTGERPGPGMTRLSDRIARVLRLIPGEGIAHVGDYYLPDPVAQVIENHLSKGLVGNPLYDIPRMAANAMNQFQLGLSAFHFTFVSIDAATSTMALGIREFLSGRPVSGVTKIAKGLAVLPSVVSTYRTGGRLAKAYVGKIPMNPELEAMVRSVTEAGGRIHVDPIYRAPAFSEFLSRVKRGNYLGALLNLPFSAIGAASKPLFEVYVPRMKLGVFAQMAKSEMEAHPGATLEEMRPLLQKAWDSVDNRLGMMVYDNLFWNKMLKDSAMIMTRSVGWNLGTIRELGGGIMDVGKLLKNREVSHRLSYVIALPVMTAWLGGMYYYMHHGKAPDHLLDYFYPPTGEKRPDGTDIRIAMPTYMKDVFSYSNSIPRTLASKLNPLWEGLYEMLQNKDFYGDRIANENDPLVQRMKDRAAFIFGTFEPFSIRNLLQRQGESGAGAESFLGFTVAPHVIGETPAQTLMHQLLSRNAPSGGRTPEERAKGDVRRTILSDLRNKKDASADIRKALSDGILTQKDVVNLYRGSAFSPLVNGVKRLGLTDALRVYHKANPSEKKEILPFILPKLRSLATMSAEQKAQVIPWLRAISQPQTKSKKGLWKEGL